MEGALDAAAAAFVRAACEAVDRVSGVGAGERVLATVGAVLGVPDGAADAPTPARHPGYAPPPNSEEAAVCLAEAAAADFVAASEGAGAGGDGVAARWGALQRHGRFACLADALLSVAAPDWLPQLGAAGRSRFDALLAAAPAAPALEALAGHVGAVAPVPGGDGGGPGAAALGADVAEALFWARFVDGGGVGELAAHCSAWHVGKGCGGAGGAGAAPPAQTCPNQHPPCASTCGPAGLAGLLASVADHGPPAVARGLAARAVAAAPTCPALAGTLLARLALRGHAAPAASGLWGVVEAASAQGGGGVDGGEGGTAGPAGPTAAPLAATLAAVPDSRALEALAAALLGVAAAVIGGDGQAAASALLRATGGEVWGAPAVRFLIEDQLLTRRTPPPAVGRVLLALLSARGALPDATTRLAQAWAPPSTAAGLPPARQACMTWLLAAALAGLGGPRVAACPALVSAALTGVGVRLDSPIEATRRQGMRVGDALARVLVEGRTRVEGGAGDEARATPAEPLADGAASAALPPPGAEALDAAAGPGVFAGCGDVSLLPEEWWHATCGGLTECGASASPPAPPTVPAAPRFPELERDVTDWRAAAAAGGGATPFSLDDADGDDDDPDAASLVTISGAPPPTPALAAGLSHGKGRPAGLRDVAAALRKADDGGGVVAALRAAGKLIAARPDELRAHAPELATALLYTRPPAWADDEADGAGRPAADGARHDALVGLLAAAPDEAAAPVAAALTSPHVDLRQRLAALDALAGAARTLAAVPVVGDGGEAGEACGRFPAGSPSTNPLGRSRVTAPASLAASTTFRRQRTRNEFARHALPWAAALLRECDVVRHGVDLLGRDSVVLGRLLTTLAGFAAAAGPCTASAALAGAVLELVQADRVFRSDAPYVRRCALAAAATVVACLPPSRVASACLAADGGGGDAGDAALGARLKWARTWAAGEAVHNVDPQAAALAAACVATYDEVAARALAAPGEGAGALSGDADPVGRQISNVVIPGAACLRLD